MTRQELFDLFVETSKNGGFPSGKPEPHCDDGYSCLYRTEDGKKCLIGLLIDDQDYNSNLENLTPSHDEIWERIKNKIPYIQHKDHLRSLQCIHDKLARRMFLYKEPWDHEEFVRQLSQHFIFKNIIQSTCTTQNSQPV